MNNLIIPQNEKQPRTFGFVYVLQNIEMPEVYDEPPIYSEWSSHPIAVIEQVARLLSAEPGGTA